MAQCLLYKYLGGSGGEGLPPEDVSNIKVKKGNAQLVINWDDPQDSILNGQELSKWKGTKLVMKESGYPLKPNDGTLIVDSTARNQFSKNGVTVPNLINNKEYFFSLFPYSTKEMINIGIENMTSGTPIDRIEPKSKLADYTWKEIQLISGYAATDNSVWNTYNIHVGDSKPITISGNMNYQNISGTWDCVVMGLNHNSSIEGTGITFSFPFKYKKTGMVFSSAFKSGSNKSWETSIMRNDSGTIIYNLLPAELQAVIKTVTKYTDCFTNDKPATNVKPLKEKIFVPSEFEIFGKVTNTSPAEASYQLQYDYYKTFGKDKYTLDSRPTVWWTRDLAMESVDGKGGMGVCVDASGEKVDTEWSSHSLGYVPHFVV